MERAVLIKTGSLARPVDSYPLPYLQALLLYGDEATNELNKIAQGDEELDWLFQDVNASAPSRKRGRGKVSGPPKRRPPPSSYDEPILTGDPVADEWERAIARGEVPDLDAHPAEARNG
jgi:hypothetical protein